MAKKATSIKTKDNTPESDSKVPVPRFPAIVQKKRLDIKEIVPDQIILIPNAFDGSECQRFIKFMEEMPLELTPLPKKVDAQRVNYRISIQSPSFAGTLFAVLSPHLPAFPYPESRILRKANSKPNENAFKARAAHSFNSNVRMYKYIEGQYFGCHYDDSVTDPATGAHSEWTLLIYLSGKEDGVVGGETIFYPGEGKKAKEQPVKPPLQRGMALLHRHGYECLRHEGALVQKGIKYILRSDVMFID